MRAIAYSAGAGLILMLALVYAIRDYAATASSAAPPVQILIDALGTGAAKLLLLVVIGAMLFCGLANMTSNTRQIFAFSRDGAMPGSRWWHSVSLRTRTPVKAVWLAAACPLVLIIPAWWSHTAFTAISDHPHLVQLRADRTPWPGSTSTRSRRTTGSASPPNGPPSSAAG